MHLKCTLRSAAIQGVRAVPVDVEVVITQGLPGMAIVGMPDAAVRESQERVKSAIKSCGFTMPSDKIVVNLAPSSLRKAGSGFDLPIAAAILGATGQCPAEKLAEYLWVGELSLQADVRPVFGSLSYAVCARECHLKLAVSSDTQDSAPLDGLDQYGIGNLQGLRLLDLQPLRFQESSQVDEGIDFSSIRGHAMAKRAMQVAAAGNHGILLMGPPGSGKSMLARALPSILPALDEGQSIEAAMVHSVAGERVDGILAGRRPFRKIHHSASLAGLVGGGNPVRPGEISLAHEGVLFLDELPEFKTSALQALRQPMEQGNIVITRAMGSVELPAKFMLVAAANPCPCGYFGDPDHECTCSPAQVRTYQDRIGGPLLDRIDMHVDVWRIDPAEMLGEKKESSVSSAVLRDGVLTGRRFARYRAASFGDRATLDPECMMLACRMGDATQATLENIARVQHMSGRAIIRLLSIARTIADMQESLRVEEAHVLEAAGLRLRKGI